MRKNPRAYYCYGEGSIHHSPDKQCPLFEGRRHPMIQRTEYPSIWHYRWQRIADWIWERHFFGHIRILDDKTFTFGRIGGWLFEQAHPRYPSIYVEFDPKDSIYDRE